GPRSRIESGFRSQYHVVFEVDPRYQQSPDALKDIYVRSSTKSLVPLSAFARYENAIMMIDFALEAERKGGKPPEEAIYQACLLRFRPIMMTTMAALLGGLPLALGLGEGSEFRQPLGITIVGGLIVSQMLTLFTTPVGLPLP